jgi:hypothetical protein
MPTQTLDEPNYTDNEYKDDDKLFVMFFMEAVHNKTKSDLEGRPIFDEKPMVKIVTPGSKDILVNKASEHYQRRFAKQWERFKRNQEQSVDGTPLEQVPFLTVGQIAELKALNVLTLEGLAGMSDSVAHRFMGFHDTRTKAQRFLEAAKSAAPITAMQAQIDDLKNTNEVLQRQLQELLAANDAKKDVNSAGAPSRK